MHVYGVKFKTNNKTYNFCSEDSYNINTKVIVETEKGRQLGIIEHIDKTPLNKDLKEIMGRATDEDYDIYLKNLVDAQKALKETKILVKTFKLNMNLVDASYSLDRKVLLFNFISEERVDFREIVKELASRYHTRIELHQIGVRDKSKEVGGMGMCGRELCCHNFLDDVNPININMVKNQNIALNPTKINGACGRLLCCFTYENDLYEENRKLFPKIGEKIQTEKGEGTVIDINILKKTYKVKIDENTIEEIGSDDSLK